MLQTGPRRRTCGARMPGVPRSIAAQLPSSEWALFALVAAPLYRSGWPARALPFWAWWSAVAVARRSGGATCSTHRSQISLQRSMVTRSWRRLDHALYITRLKEIAVGTFAQEVADIVVATPDRDVRRRPGCRHTPSGRPAPESCVTTAPKPAPAPA